MSLAATLTRPNTPSFVGIVIPARDEHGAVATAVRSVRRALEHEHLAGCASWIVVVDDDSMDGTAFSANHALKGQGEVLSGAFGAAGAARRAGFDRLLQMAHKQGELSYAWFATTDADSRVPIGWLAGHLRWWREGVDAVAGMVEPEWESGASLSLRRRYEEMMATLGTGQGHSHVYGANLGFTARAYLGARVRIHR